MQSGCAGMQAKGEYGGDYTESLCSLVFIALTY